jgi:hypothetical protein
MCLRYAALVLVRMSASMPNNPLSRYLTFGKSDVTHSTILAFAQMAERRSTLRDLGSGGLGPKV